MSRATLSLCDLRASSAASFELLDFTVRNFHPLFFFFFAASSHSSLCCRLLLWVPVGSAPLVLLGLSSPTLTKGLLQELCVKYLLVEVDSAHLFSG